MQRGPRVVALEGEVVGVEAGLVDAGEGGGFASFLFIILVAEVCDHEVYLSAGLPFSWMVISSFLFLSTSF